jgi:hypothetical protein
VDSGSLFDCIDARSNAFHREAVPVLLPLIETMDNYSWWESQALNWRVNMGCISEYVVVLDSFVPSGNEHADYPKGRDIATEMTVLEAVYGPVGLVPWPINASAQLSCHKGRSVEMLTELSPSSRNWMADNKFLTCKGALKSRFDAFVGLPVS